MGLLAMAGMVSGLGEGIRETGKTAQAGFIQSGIQENINAFQLKKQQEQLAYDSSRVDREQAGANQRQEIQSKTTIDAANIGHPDRRNEEAVSNSLKALESMSAQWHKQMDAKALFNILPTQDDLDRITKIETMRDTIIGHTGDTDRQIEDFSHFNDKKAPPDVVDWYKKGGHGAAPGTAKKKMEDGPHEPGYGGMISSATGAVQTLAESVRAESVREEDAKRLAPVQPPNPSGLTFAQPQFPISKSTETPSVADTETYLRPLAPIDSIAKNKKVLVPPPVTAEKTEASATGTSEIKPTVGLLNSATPTLEAQPAAVPRITLSRTKEAQFQQDYPAMAKQFGFEKNPDANTNFDVRAIWKAQQPEKRVDTVSEVRDTPTLAITDPEQDVSLLTPWVGAAARLGETTENENTEAADLRRFEGLKLKPYQDRNGWAIGYGTQLDKNLSAAERSTLSITEEDAKAYAIMDLRRQRAELANYGWFNALSTEKQNGIAQLAYTMGVDGVLKFPKMIKALEAGDDAKVAAEIRNSDWYKQVKPTRGEFVIRQLQGN